MKRLAFTTISAIAALAVAGPAVAQSRSASSSEGYENTDRSGGSRNVRIDPYIEASQLVVAELSPGDDVVTFTQLAAGVDATVAGRNNGASVSVRYEYNVGYGDAIDSNTLSGVARGYASIVPQLLTVEAGGLAARTRVDGNGALTPNPLINQGADSRIYSVYAGPALATRAGDVDVSANYRVGYTRVESPDAVVTAPGADPVDVFDDSLVQSASVRVGTRAGEPLPIGVGVGAGWMQEDVSNLDQRIRDAHVRGDVTVPVTQSLAVIGGVGYEDVQVSSRDAVLDAGGAPVVGPDGRLVTDKSQPRQIAYETDGLIWDVGVMWRPSSRTVLQASVGRRYDSTTYYGSLSYAPTSRSSVSINVYDAFSGFGNQLTTALANLPTDFTANRNALTGDLNGCVDSLDGNNCVTGALGSVRSAAFRSRGVSASYSMQLGRLSGGIGAGYDRRKFVAAPGTVLAAANGVADESYYLAAYLSGQVGQSGGFSANAYANWLNSGFANAGDVFAAGGSASYTRRIFNGLSARAAVALDNLDSELASEDLTAASALLGLRYDF
ncbi:MAG: preprotein translocase subunit YajC [Sphingomonadaceae bacterium]|nr:preprotein translocase subunit YajC [Sphingomonadaceae bacterium]